MPDAADAAAAEAVVDPALQAAVDAGEPEKVTELLKTLAGALSKSAQKKLVKSAEINKKKRDQGKAPQATAPAGKAAPAPAPAPRRSVRRVRRRAASVGGGGGTSTCESTSSPTCSPACALALPELPDAAQALGARSDALGAAIAAAQRCAATRPSRGTRRGQ